MKVKTIGSILKVVYPLFLGWLVFFIWRALLSEEIVQPKIWSLLILMIFFLIAFFTCLFFIGFAPLKLFKDKIKYLSLIAISFGASSIALMQSTDHFVYDTRYAGIERNIEYFNENKDYLTSKPYAEFLEARKSLDIAKLKEYTKSMNSLVSIDKNLSMTLVLVRETVTSFNVRDKLNDMNADNFVSKAEFNQFRDFVLQNSKGNERVALVMAR
jgi:hypothetical protein